MSGRVVAMGGFHLGLVELMVELTGRERPRLLYVPTAQGDSPATIAAFYEWSQPLGVERDHLRLFGIPHDPVGRIEVADAILVAGGNTANMLAVWRAHGVDAAFATALRRGAVLGGSSAGANCWFEACVTDSFGPELQALGDGLGLAGGSFCPHYDSEPQRRPTFTRLVRRGVLPAGLACDDGAAIVIENRLLVEVVTALPAASGYRVTPDGEALLDARLLRGASDS